MSISRDEAVELAEELLRLSPAQQRWVKSAIKAFSSSYKFWRSENSDIISEEVLRSLGDRLLSHHSGSHQALSKDRFEFALESALNDSGIPSSLVTSRTNRGHDINIKGTPVSLKTEAAANIKDDIIHVSKWMELGRGEWKLPLLLRLFLEHLESYERIFTFRRLRNNGNSVRYELVEIPKPLLLEAEHCDLEGRPNSKQNPQPGYGYVRDDSGNIKYSLYFDGGSERKLQIKHLRKDLCKVHATWTFDSLVI